MESLQAEVAPFGINTTIVNPGFFRTELLTEQSTNYAEASIADYDEGRAKQLEFWKSQNGKQGGDPAKLARALVTKARVIWAFHVRECEKAREPRKFLGELGVSTTGAKSTSIPTDWRADAVSAACACATDGLVISEGASVGGAQ